MPGPRRHVAGSTTARAVATLVAIAATASPAADTAPDLVATFTRQVQPLILNKCAAGACHGGPSAHAPRFRRGPVSGRIDRADTLANIESLTTAVATPRNLPAFLATISRRHPADAVKDSLRLAALTPQERATLERWLVAATGAAVPVGPTEPTHPRDGSTTAVTLTTVPATNAIPDTAAVRPNAKPPAPPMPNRFRAMLEAAANPPMLPPPEEPKGIILGKDRGD